MDPMRVAALEAKLLKHEKYVALSALYAHTKTLLQPYTFTKIRCLALGSPTQEFQALYQLAYLKLLASTFNISVADISCYDPAFVSEDTSFLTSLGYVVENDAYSPSPEDTQETLYYMPHAPRMLTESILAKYRPRLLLANDFSVTMGTLTKAKFLLEFPNLAALVHMYENAAQKSLNNNTGDGFTTVQKKRRHRIRKNVYVEPELDYRLLEKYFSNVQIRRIQCDTDAVWKDSFSDLAINEIVMNSPASKGE